MGEWMLLAAAMLSQSGGSSEPFKPSGAWSIDYGDDACTLSRNLGSNQGILALRREDITRSGALVVLSVPDAGRSRNGQFKGSFLVAGTEPVDVIADSRSLSDSDIQLITLYLDAPKLAALTSTGKFALPVARNEHLWLDMGRLDEPLAALAKCSDDLVTSLGVPLAELDAVMVTADPVGTVDLSPRHIPPDLKRQYWEARSKALFEIDAQGKIAECRIISYSGPEALRGSACEQPFRMRFKPARSETDTPVRSWAVLAVTSTPCVGRPTKSGEMTC